MVWLAVIVGGAFGTALRHGVNTIYAHALPRPVPYATATVNLIGSGVIGVLAGLIASGRVHMSMTMRTFIFVGILGGFTTFSSFMLDTLTLSYGGEFGMAILNVAGQLILGLAAVWAGYYLGVAI